MADVDMLLRNRLLALIPPDEVTRLAPAFDAVSLGLKDFLYREDEPIEHVYFPITGVLSLVSQLDDGRGVDVATVGNEGMVGLPVFLQATVTSAHRAFCQVPGESLSMPAQRFADVIAGSHTTAACTGSCTGTPRR